MRPTACLSCTLALAVSLAATASRASAQRDSVRGLPVDPTRIVRFTTDEGTWMSLDVSPDGRTLVFDLLDALYTLPIAGGRAKQVTVGTSLDRQPRFSPDGAHLAFISDRGGSENVWIADRDGRHARQLSHLEGYDASGAVISPVWSPDGKSVVVAQKIGATHARAHVVIPRPVRSGWLLAAYDVATGRMHWISDTSADRAHPMTGPAFNPRTGDLYAARDLVDDGTRPAEWGLVHVDHRTGLIVPDDNASRRGRASVRPLVSPDGRYLVYASSSGSRWGLRVRNLRTAREHWLVHEQLDIPQTGGEARDLAPGYAFTPDSRSVIAAYGGKIHHLSLATGQSMTIRFVAPVVRAMAPLTVYQFGLSDSAARVRGVNQPALSPDGTQIAFSALDRIWLMTLPHDGQPSGAPRRLSADSVGEFYPSWSPDGRSIVYSTWRDGVGGAVWRINVATTADSTPRAGVRLSRDSGLYFNPVYSSTGSRVFAVRLPLPPDRQLIDPYWFVPVPSLEPTLVTLPLEGGDARVVTSLATVSNMYIRYPVRQLYVTADTGRIYVGLTSWRTDGTDERATLHVVDRDGSVPPIVEPYDVSGVLGPSGQDALIGRKFVLYEVDHCIDGDTIDPDHLSSGERWGTALAPWISWSRDGRRVAFQQGGELYVGDVARGVPIAFQRLDVPLAVAPRVPSGTIVLRGARIVTMRGMEVIARGDVVVTGSRIVAIGASGHVSIPHDAHVFDVTGKTIIPGYIDVHDHEVLPKGVHAAQPWKLLLQLAYGVTTTRDPALPMENDLYTYSERQRTGDLLGPRMFTTGMPEYGTDPPIRSLADALAFTRPYAEDFRTETFKLYYDASTDRRARQLLAQAARARGLNATVHTNGIEQEMAGAIDGLSGVEHAPDIAIYNDVATFMALSGTTQTHTYIINAGSLPYMVSQDGPPTDHAAVRRLVPPSGRASLCGSCSGEVYPAWGPAELDNITMVVRGAARIMAHGGRIAIGGHGAVSGLGTHWEMWLHAVGGLPNHDVLRAATIGGATAIGHATDLGSLEPGKLADLQVLDHNPLDRIQNTASIRYVMQNGRLYEVSDLTQIWPDRKALAPTYLWQR